MLERLRREIGREFAVGDAPRQADVSLISYRHALARLRGYYHPLEQRLVMVNGWDAVGIDIRARLKVPSLDADLIDLGCDAPLPIAPCPDVPAVDSMAAGFGCLYVLEKAAESGRFISREFQYLRPIGPQFGGRFLHGYGLRSHVMWREFGLGLAGLGTSGDVGDRLLAGAADALRTLRRWVEQDAVRAGLPAVEWGSAAHVRRHPDSQKNRPGTC